MDLMNLSGCGDGRGVVGSSVVQEEFEARGVSNLEHGVGTSGTVVRIDEASDVRERVNGRVEKSGERDMDLEIQSLIEVIARADRELKDSTGEVRILGSVQKEGSTREGKDHGRSTGVLEYDDDGCWEAQNAVLPRRLL